MNYDANGEALEAREALEDKVYDLHPELDMVEIQRMTDNQLQQMVDQKMERRNDQPKPAKRAKPARTIKAKWVKVSSGYDIKNDALVWIETWNKNGINHEKIEPCHGRVTYQDRQVSASILKHYLITGQWVKRVPKPAKYRAVVYLDGKTMHLGYFATEEEKKDAIFLHKMGIFNKKA
jgi:hypothetical protein